MAFDAFLKIDGIDGESQDAGHEKWIEVLSFSWGASAAVNTGHGAGGAAVGKVTQHAFSFTKQTDSASPNIFLKLDQGASFQKVSLAARKASADNSNPTGAPASDFLKIDFYNVFISSYTEGGNIASDAAPFESVSFVFQKIAYDVVPAVQLDTGGDGTAPPPATWDFTQNRGPF